MFLWVHFDGCPEALRPGSACINQYLLLLIIKNKATPCLEHTSLGFLPAGSPDASLTQCQVWGEGRCSPSFQEPLNLEMEGGGQLQQLPQEAEERLGTHLVGSLALAGSKTAGVDLAPAQEAIAAFPASVWGGGVETPALPPLYIGRHNAGSAGRACRDHIFYRWGN